MARKSFYNTPIQNAICGLEAIQRETLELKENLANLKNTGTELEQQELHWLLGCTHMDITELRSYLYPSHPSNTPNVNGGTLSNTENFQQDQNFSLSTEAADTVEQPSKEPISEEQTTNLGNSADLHHDYVTFEFTPGQSQAESQEDRQLHEKMVKISRNIACQMLRDAGERVREDDELKEMAFEAAKSMTRHQLLATILPAANVHSAGDHGSRQSSQSLDHELWSELTTNDIDPSEKTAEKERAWSGGPYDREVLVEDDTDTASAIASELGYERET